MCGQDRLSSSASAPASWHAAARVCQCFHSASEPDPAMMEATSTRCGHSFLMRVMRGIHQSIGLSEISSQFQEEWSDAFARLRMEIADVSQSDRRNLVLGPRTLTTGCRPIVLVTTPPQPASKALRMLDSDSVGGADESRKGFSNRRPVKSTDRSTGIGTLLRPRRSRKLYARRRVLELAPFRPGQRGLGPGPFRIPPAALVFTLSATTARGGSHDGFRGCHRPGDA